MAKVKSIICEIYKKEISVFLGTYNEMLTWAKKEFTNPAYKEFLDTMEEASPGGGADCHYDKSSCIIRLDKFPETAEEISLANHELMHATMFIMDSCGVEYVAWSNNEAFTYLNEWLSKKAYETDGYEKVL
jgi:hypothetical protein